MTDTSTRRPPERTEDNSKLSGEAERPKWSDRYRSNLHYRRRLLDDAASEAFLLVGLDVGFATALFWGGRPAVAGLAGFNLYPLDQTPCGVAPLKLNETLLPVRGSFFDITHRSLPELNDFVHGPGGAKKAKDVEPYYLQNVFDFLQALHPPLVAPFALPGTRLAAPTQYLLEGVYLTGERNGTVAPSDARTWTQRERDLAQAEVEAALDAIRARGLVERLSPDPDGVDFDRLRAGITVRADCGEVGAFGLTEPMPGGDGTRSRITINGNLALMAALSGEREFLISVVLHELVHALQRLRGEPAAVADTVLTGINGILSEVRAYRAIWDLIDSGDIRFAIESQLAEIAAGIQAILTRYNRFIDVFVSNRTLADEQREALRALNREIGRLFRRYRDALRRLPDPERIWGFRDRAGELRSLLEQLEALSEFFPE